MILKVRTYLILVLVMSPFISALNIYAQTASSVIESNVKVSICGDGIVEGYDEDCELGVELTDSCVSIGYDGGELECDVSCQFDEYGCFYKVVPPEQKPPISDNIPQEDLERAYEVLDDLIARVRLVEEEPIPNQLISFDTNGNGVIDGDEILTTVLQWYKWWKISFEIEIDDLNEYETSIDSCDLNRDGVCDIVDFSILLYYSK